ncbi:WD40 repeat domain-containing protein [Amycolatopsis sp. YIM 10]|uniref:WD40 repeat domain-containing protein n=1 Tax=Amycolatopsis sp. YIM 10 TaxID=2653857 RepID=UPI00129012F4|nr:WD40 repeat domain-containing protein [Amycolatopsis sp. YIM 10]
MNEFCARGKRAKTLARAGRVQELRDLTAAGDEQAAWHLVRCLARAGQFDELRERMTAGDRFARWAYSKHLVCERRLPEAIEVLRPLADAGSHRAQRRLASLLAGQGRYAEAVAQLRRAPEHSADLRRVGGWLRACGLADRSGVRTDYLDRLRREGATLELSWVVLLWWRARTADAVALLADIGPSDWLHERLVEESRGWWLAGFRAVAIDLLATSAYRRTRAALLSQQKRRDEAIAELRVLAAEGERGAESDLAAILGAEQPWRELLVAPVRVNGLAFSQDGEALAVWGHGPGSRAVAVLWEVATGAPSRSARLSTPFPGGVTFRADGTVEELPRPFGADFRQGTAVAPAAGLRATGSPGGGVDVRELATGRLVRTIDTPATTMALHPDGSVLATSDSVDGTVRLWRLSAQARSAVRQVL